MRKIENNFFGFFHPPSATPGNPCISAFRPNFENRLGQYNFFAKITLQPKFQSFTISSLVCGWVVYEKVAKLFKIGGNLYRTNSKVSDRLSEASVRLLETRDFQQSLEEKHKICFAWFHRTSGPQ